VIRLRT